VRALELAGFIRGYSARLDAERLGYEVTFFALVGLSSQSLTVLKAFEELVASWDEARECHMIRGGGDFLLKFVARNTAHENELTTRLTDAPNVTKVATFQAIRASKLEPGVPIADPPDE
jgi:DNA-binding Lrp family transcriptional regulator